MTMIMRRTSNWPAAVAVGLSLATLIVVGCTGKTPPAAAVPGGGAEADTTGSRPAEADAKPLANFPDDLAGVLLISGEMVGYTEPCGCTAGQKGGLIRRLAFTDLLRTERKWPLALIDLGSLINDPHKHGGPEQTKIKFDTSLKALTKLQYSAIALSAEDLKLGVDETLMRFLNTLPDGPDAPKVVVANVTPVDGFGFEKRIRPSIRTAVGPLKIGVTAVLDPEAFARIKDDAKDNLLTVQAPEKAAELALADLEKDTDLQILMVQGPVEMARRLGLANPGFDIVVATSDFVDPKDKPETLNGGRTWLVSVGRKGQYIGAVGLPRDLKKPKLYQRITLAPRFDRYKGRAEEMRKLIDEEFVADLKSADVLAKYIKIPYSHGTVTSNATYVGAETCKGCHPNTYNKWQSTQHAHAYESLTKDPKRNREADADCVRCHTTGFEFIGGFTTAETTPFLKGNQCENCHGPGSAHAASPDDPAIRKSIARTAEEFRKSDTGCINCHDEDNSPHGFDFPVMWSKIMHRGLDDMKDPKVHQGVKVAR
ncbi:MAG: 5-nucleotidase/2,3-cyclic phosphodiesterase-like hydrolase [Planctomycetota bacterium]|nr:5-nucleotidase/2,3-cyclic phosphodiesterase-like hydrolase [Planctomycetota bacterium]